MSATTTHYRAVHPLAVASVVLGGLSILTAAHWMLAILPLAGMFLGWRAMVKIDSAPNDWIGHNLALTGICLSLGFWVIGFGWWTLAKHSGVPFGYTPIHYDTLQPDPNMPTMPIPQTALDMQDKKVYLQGFMQPRRQQVGIKEFILTPATADCPFCIPNPKPTEMVRVILQGDLTAAYTTHRVSVAGRFRVEPDDPSGVPYAIEADVFR
jgi:hypothetical protein